MLRCAFWVDLGILSAPTWICGKLISGRTNALSNVSLSLFKVIGFQKRESSLTQVWVFMLEACGILELSSIILRIIALQCRPRSATNAAMGM